MGQYVSVRDASGAVEKQATSAFQRCHSRLEPIRIDPLPGCIGGSSVVVPELLVFIAQQDYVGAITLLEFERKAKENRPHLLMWLAFAYSIMYRSNLYSTLIKS